MKFRGGRTPFGFSAINGELVFNPLANGLALVWMMKAREDGYSLRSIALKANAQGYPGPECPKWNHASVARVIANGKRYSDLIPLKYILNN